MAVKTKDELMSSIKTIFGDDMNDDKIALLEDISDTLDTTNDSTDWKKKFEDNDKMWRDKYTSRFFDTPAEPSKNDEPNDEPTPEEVKAEEIKIDDLFETK